MATDTFLSTLSLRRATSFTLFLGSVEVFLSTLSLRRATAQDILTALNNIFLSTLSLRRATRARLTHWTRTAYFYPRSPCGERHNLTQGVFNLFTFLSTLSLRRATARVPACFVGASDFYPRSPCGERPWQRGSRITYVEISIHALLAESDRIEFQLNFINQKFLSTLSLRRATWMVPNLPLRKFLFLSTLSLRRATAGAGNNTV